MEFNLKEYNKLDKNMSDHLEKEVKSRGKSKKHNSHVEPRFQPTINLSDKDLPEIKDWEVGKTYHLMMVVEQTSLRKNEFLESDKEFHASFNIKSVKAVNPDKIKELTNKFKK